VISKLRYVIEWGCRIYVFIFLFTYGAAKLFGGQFYTPSDLPPDVAIMTLSQAPNFELAWTFMGRSFGYMAFIGVSEIIGAVLLLFNRTKLLGTVILITIMTNVIVFDIFFLDKYGALASATIYTIMLFIILYLNKNEVIEAFKNLTKKDESDIPLNQKIGLFAFSVLFMAIIFGIDQLIVNLLGHGKG
jgi:uncharacterized membrane protein (UPF0127 family)